MKKFYAAKGVQGAAYISAKNEVSSALRCSEVAGLEEKAESTGERQADQLSATDADRGLARV